MKIGIVSDTHGRANRLREAMDAFRQRHVEAIVHCGDIGSHDCAKILGSSTAKAYAVAGNMDRNTARLAREAKAAGVTLSWEVVEVPLGNGRALAATHGHDGKILSELVRCGQFPYVCHGHTHESRDEQIGPVRVINPGALHNSAVHTIAVLDTQTDTLESIELKR